MTASPGAPSTSRPDTQAGPGRFVTPTPEQERPPALQRIGAAAALLGLVVGVPALLVWLSGAPPIPTRLPTRDDLTQTLGVEQLLTVLVAIVWLAWLQFVVCLAVELLSAVKRQGVPTPVPLSGPTQRLARVLVGALLLTSVIGGQVASVVSAVGSGARADTTISATATPSSAGPSVVAPSSAPTMGPGLGAAVTGVEADVAGPVASVVAPDSSSGATTVQSDGTYAPGTKVYTVQPRVGHHHDSLWEIAEKHLGDGRRYQEIYDLNVGRIQPDGRSLHLARLIQPGWDLVMPADAVGVTQVTAPAPVVPVAPGQQSPVAPGQQGPVGSDTVTAGGAVADAVGASGAVSGEVAAPGGQVAPANPFVAAFSTSGIFAACVLLALLRTRRRNAGGSDAGADAAEAEVGLRAGADLDRTRWVDTALRGLGARYAGGTTGLPLVYAARADDDELSLLLAPARTDAPDPWVVHDDGARWTLRRTDLGRGSDAGPAAYPSLVCVGRDADGSDVFIDLEAADGPVQISGDPVLAAQVATALAVQLATLPWADSVRVSAVGLPEQLAAVGAGSIDIVADAETVVSRLEQRAAGAPDDVLTGRLARTGDTGAEYAVFATAIDARHSGRLSAVTSAGRDPVGVIAVGELPGAQWQLQVDESGTVRMPLLGITVAAHRVSADSAAALAELFATAQEVPAAPEPQGLRGVPQPFAEDGADLDDAAYAIAPARVGILGPVTVRAEGPLDPSRLPLAEEIVAYLAVQPQGAHPTVLASAIWPRGVGEAVARASVERVRDWLGTDPDGSWRLRTDAAGRYSLAPSVALDWDVFCALVDRARRTPASEADLLRRALHLVRGEAFEAHPEHRYGWLARTTVQRTIERSVVQVAHRLVEIGRTGTDPDGAAQAAGAAAAGLRLARGSQLLWRDVLEIEALRGGPQAVLTAADEMRHTLEVADIPVEPETEALIEHLTSGHGPGSSAAHA